jgi:4-hydroxybenzoate polyprenyltransferase
VSDVSAAPKPNKIKVLLELVKFEHSIFALPYAYIGALFGAVAGARALGRVGPVPGAPPTSSVGVLLPGTSAWIAAGSWPTLAALFWVTVAMVAARAIAFIVNRAVDKEIDARNPRTAGRAVPAGLIKAWELWLFAAFMVAVYLHAVFQLAPVTHVLWPVPLAMFLVYPYLKRFTPLAHFWLGACLGLGAVGGWAAVGAPLGNPAPWLLGAGVAIWTAGFDIIYATQDHECDMRDGVHSVPADYGIARGLLVTRVTHALAVVLFALGGVFAGAGWPYYAGVAVAGILLAYESAIISPQDLSRVDAAFFTVNGMVAVVILVGALADRLMAG